MGAASVPTFSTATFGAMTRVQGPPPQGQANGVIQAFNYDEAMRVKRVTTGGRKSRLNEGEKLKVTLARDPA